MNSTEEGPKRPAVISPDRARRFFEDGARRWRKPHQGRRIATSGLDTDSMDFRGVRAAFAVTDTLAKDRDVEDTRLPVEPDVAAKHYALGLTAIRQAGLLPLDDRFVAGYQRWADAVVEDQARLVREAQDTASAEHPVE